jgi:hypothetical protein
MDKNGIVITGLTPKQVAMLDTMWAIDSEDDYLEWRDTLSGDEVAMADQLIQLLLVEIDDNIDTDDLSMTTAYLKKYML